MSVFGKLGVAFEHHHHAHVLFYEFFFSIFIDLSLKQKREENRWKMEDLKLYYEFHEIFAQYDVMLP
jgi:hypothetical protein